MACEDCCNRDWTQNVFPDPVIPEMAEVKGCWNRNCRHFCRKVGIVWTWVKLTLLCLEFMSLHTIFLARFFGIGNSSNSYRLLESWFQTERKIWMSHIYRRLHDTTTAYLLFYCHDRRRHHHIFIVSLPSRPPQFCCFPTATTTTFVVFHCHHHHYTSINNRR